MKYRINKRCFRKISSFYHNVAKKYKHTYSEELMHKNIDEAIDSMYQIEKTLLRREPIVSGWEGFLMANTDKWYFAYTIEGDTITIVDANHAPNPVIRMHLMQQVRQMGPDEACAACNDVIHILKINLL